MIIAVSSHPAQYRAPLYRYLSQHPDTAIRAVYLRDTHLRESYDPDFATAFRWAVDLLGGYDSVFLQRGAGRRRFSFWSSMVASFAAVRQALESVTSPPAVLLHSHATPEGLGGFLAAKASRVPAMLMTESELFRRRSIAKRIMRGLVFPALLRLYDALLYIGTNNRSFYERYGVKDERLFFTPYSVDNAGFIADLAGHLAARNGTRRELGAGSKEPLLLFAGKLIARKRPLDVIKAVATLEPSRRPFVVFVGSGPLASSLRETAKALGVSKFAITGFKNANEMGRYYAAADALVLPSEFETWGLVVNEAMVHSLPSIVSDQCGCALDLVQDGRTGYRFPAGDIKALADRIARVFRDNVQYRTMGETGRAVINTWSYVEVQSGLRKALAAVARTSDLSSRTKTFG